MTPFSPRVILKRILPRSFRLWLRRLMRPALYEGDYRSWREAQEAASGYDHPMITRKVIEAALAVRDGRAAWDRDTVLFDMPEANPPLLRSLRHVARAHAGRLRVLDFGGALGSTWWQHHSFLADLTDVRWTVVEQADLVEIGRQEFTSGPVRFCGSIAEVWEIEHPNAVLLSAVLPYLSGPHALLDSIRALGPDHIIIDRTGMTKRGRDLLTVQRVPPSIYEASYPCWFFDRQGLLEPFLRDYVLREEWTTADDIDIDAYHCGMLLERRK